MGHYRLLAVVWALVLTLASALAGSPALAGSAADARAADLAAARHFKLTESFVRRWEAFGEDVAKQPCKLSPFLVLQNGKQKSLAAVAATYDAKPGVHAVLAAHDLTAREVLVGMMTLLGAGMQEFAKNHPELVADGTIEKNTGFKISQANMAFYRAHEAQIHHHQTQLGREERKRNGGKLPACMR